MKLHRSQLFEPPHFPLLTAKFSSSTNLNSFPPGRLSGEGMMRKQVCLLIGCLVLGSTFYAAWLTSDWGTLLACAPAVLGIAGIVVGLLVGVMFFGRAETALEPVVVPASGVQVQRARPRAVFARTTYNERKIRTVLADSLEIPEKYTQKRKRPREVAQVIKSNCTGCGICVPFCPADCIETETHDRLPERMLPPVRV